MANGASFLSAWGLQDATDELVLSTFKPYVPAEGDAPVLREALIRELSLDNIFAAIIAGALHKMRIEEQQHAQQQQQQQPQQQQQQQARVRNSGPTAKKSKQTVFFDDTFDQATPELATELSTAANADDFLTLYLEHFDSSALLRHSTFLQLAQYAGDFPFTAPSNWFRKELIMCIAVGIRSKELHDLATGKLTTVGSSVTFEQIVRALRSRMTNWRNNSMRKDFINAARAHPFAETCRQIIAFLTNNESLDVDSLHSASDRCQRIFIQMSSVLMREVVKKQQDLHPKVRWWTNESALTCAASEAHGWLTAVPATPALVGVAALQAAMNGHLKLPPPCSVLTFVGNVIGGEDSAPQSTFGMLYWFASALDLKGALNSWSCDENKKKNPTLCMLGVVNTELLQTVTAAAAMEHDGSDQSSSSTSVFRINGARVTDSYSKATSKQARKRADFNESFLTPSGALSTSSSAPNSTQGSIPAVVSTPDAVAATSAAATSSSVVTSAPAMAPPSPSLASVRTRGWPPSALEPVQPTTAARPSSSKQRKAKKARVQREPSSSPATPVDVDVEAVIEESRQMEEDAEASRQQCRGLVKQLLQLATAAAEENAAQLWSVFDPIGDGNCTIYSFAYAIACAFCTETLATMLNRTVAELNRADCAALSSEMRAGLLKAAAQATSCSQDDVADLNKQSTSVSATLVGQLGHLWLESLTHSCTVTAIGLRAPIAEFRATTSLGIVAQLVEFTNACNMQAHFFPPDANGAGNDVDRLALALSTAVDQPQIILVCVSSSKKSYAHTFALVRLSGKSTRNALKDLVTKFKATVQ